MENKDKKAELTLMQRLLGDREIKISDSPFKESTIELTPMQRLLGKERVLSGETQIDSVEPPKSPIDSDKKAYGRDRLSGPGGSAFEAGRVEWDVVKQLAKEWKKPEEEIIQDLRKRGTEVDVPIEEMRPEFVRKDSVLSDAVSETLHDLDRMTGGIVGKAYRNLTLSDEDQKYLDEIEDIASKQRSYASDALDFAGGLMTGGAVAGGIKAAALASKIPSLVKATQGAKGLIAIGGLEGALAGYGMSKTDEELEDILLYGSIGGGLGAIGVGAGKAWKSLKDGKKLRELEAAEARQIKADIDAVNNEIPVGYEDLLDVYKKSDEVRTLEQDIRTYNETKTFRGELSKPERRIIKQYNKRLSKALEKGIGQEELIQEIAHIKAVKSMRKYQDDGIMDRLAGKALNWFDSNESAKLLDKRHGTSIQEGLREASVQLNKSTVKIKNRQEELAKLLKQKRVPTEISREMLEGRHVLEESKGKIAETYEAVADLFRKAYDEVAEQFNIILPINEDLISPRVMKQRDDWLYSLNRHLMDNGIVVKKDSKAALGDNRVVADDINLQEFLSTKEGQETIKHVREYTGADIDASDVKVLTDAINLKFLDKVDDTFEVKRLLDRELNLSTPMWAIETDMVRAYNSYLTQLHTGLRKKQLIDKFKRAKDVMKFTQDRQGLNWVDNALADLIGRIPTTGATLSQIVSRKKQQWIANSVMNIQEKRGLQLIDGIVASMPHLLSLVNRGVYTSLLSNPATAIQNLLSPLTMTFPSMIQQVGALQASNIMFQALGQTVLEILKNPIKVVKGRGLSVTEEGLTPLQFRGEQDRQMALDFVKHLGNNKSLKFLNVAGDRTAELMSDTFLAMFSASEQMARMFTRNAASGLAAEIAKNPHKASKALSRVDSPSFKAKWTKKGIPNYGTSAFKEFETDMQRLINAEHLMNYDEHTKSQLARSLGPALSQFSKWPTAISGKILVPFATQRTKDASKHFFSYFVAPALILHSAQKALESSGVTDDSLYQVSLKKDLLSYAPVTSVSGLAEGRFPFMPPLVQDTLEIFKGLLFDPATLSKGLSSATLNMTGLGAVDNVIRNIEHLRYGEKEVGPLRGAIQESVKSIYNED